MGMVGIHWDSRRFQSALSSVLHFPYTAHSKTLISEENTNQCIDNGNGVCICKHSENVFIDNEYRSFHIPGHRTEPSLHMVDKAMHKRVQRVIRVNLFVYIRILCGGDRFDAVGEARFAKVDDRRVKITGLSSYGLSESLFVSLTLLLRPFSFIAPASTPTSAKF